MNQVIIAALTVRSTINRLQTLSGCGGEARVGGRQRGDRDWMTDRQACGKAGVERR